MIIREQENGEGPKEDEDSAKSVLIMTEVSSTVLFHCGSEQGARAKDYTLHKALEVKDIAVEKDQKNSDYLMEKGKKRETLSRIIDGYSDKKSKRLPTFQNGEVMIMSKEAADDGK
ncbi:hypothetical protein Bca4012_026739 [Brassica carinata]